jgi:ABC-type lipoprotein export system ATPase subunit
LQHSSAFLRRRIASIEFVELRPQSFKPSLDSEIWNHIVRWEIGDFWHIKAPSGGGKTTFFSYIAGLRNDYDGSIVIRYSDDFTKPVPLQTCNEDQWAGIRAKHITFVFQDFRLIPDLTMRQNLQVRLDARMPVSNNENKIPEDRMLRYCSELKIDSLLDRRVSLLSRGECQRCAIVRALMAPFDLIVLDEAFSHLNHELAEAAAHLVESECRTTGAGLISLDLAADDLCNYETMLRI